MEPEFYVWGVLLMFMVGALFTLILGPLNTPNFRLGSGGITGQVVASEPLEPCGCTPGKTVCAANGNHLQNYASACHAACDGAKIVYNQRCAAIPSSE